MVEQMPERPSNPNDRRGSCYRHWYAYYGQVGTSAPTCQRCGAPNPNYDASRDPHRKPQKPKK